MIYRLRYALSGAGKHMLLSLLFAAVVGGLVFGLWYPYPYNKISGGTELFVILITADVVCGPLLTFVLLNPSKPVMELRRDIGLVVSLQILALGYGVFSMAEARPVFLAFEGDRFRVVSKVDIDWEGLEPGVAIPKLSFTGPVLTGTSLLDSTDPEFSSSIQAAINGIHPSYRPARWVDYRHQAQKVLAIARPFQELRKAYPERDDELGKMLAEFNVDENDIGFLPLQSYSNDDWVVFVSMANAVPIGFMPIDGWVGQ